MRIYFFMIQFYIPATKYELISCIMTNIVRGAPGITLGSNWLVFSIRETKH